MRLLTVPDDQGQRSIGVIVIAIIQWSLRGRQRHRGGNEKPEGQELFWKHHFDARNAESELRLWLGSLERGK